MLNLIPTPAPSPADQLASALPELWRLAELAWKAECAAVPWDEYDEMAGAHANLRAAARCIERAHDIRSKDARAAAGTVAQERYP